MRARLLLCLLLYGSAQAQSFYHFPVAPEGADGDGSARTTLVLRNAGARLAKVSIDWTNDDGSVRRVTLGDLGSAAHFSITLAPGATRTLQTTGVDPSTGAASVTSDQPLGAWGMLSKFDGAGALRGEAGFGAVQTSTGFQIPVDSASAVAIYNPGSKSVSVTSTLTDENAAPLGSQTFTLGAGARLTRNVDGDLGSLNGSHGTLGLLATGPVAAQVVRTSGAILEASSLTSRRMRYFFPRLADGPSVSATLKSTFLLTNLSAKAASVSISLSREDGSPWSVSIPGMDPGDNLKTTLAPGASAIWQTDGAGSYAAGAATIRSDAPIGAQAFVSASGAQGEILSEVAAVDSRVRQQSTFPFDATSDSVSGAAFYNSGTLPANLKLTLIDADGKTVATSQLDPLPPGGQISGSVSDFFPVASVQTGALAMNAGTSFVSAVATRLNSARPWPSLLPGAAIPLSGVPIQVATTVDDKRAASASIGPKGGSLSLTDAAGNRFTLTIPANAVLTTEKITMTPVTGARGVPGTGLIAVQLAPDGLALLEPATLAIQPAGGAATPSLTPVGWFGSSAPGVYLNLPKPNSSQFAMLLTHFSNAGASNMIGGDLTTTLLNIIDLQAFYQGTATAALQAKSTEDFDAAFLAEFEEVIAPLMEVALASEDDNVILCAIYHALAYERQSELLAADPDGSITATIYTFMTEGRKILIRHAKQRCTEGHDFTALLDLLSVLRQDQLLGGGEPIPDIPSLEKQCPNLLQFEFTSLLQSKYASGGVYKGQLGAKFPLDGSWDKEILTAVKDPSKDLFAAYQLSGSGPATYDNFSFSQPGNDGCTIALAGLRPAAMTIPKDQPDGKKSQVQFAFSSGYDPSPYSISGVQLCAFCPVYRKKLVKVDLLVKPGLSFEDLSQTCPFTGTIKAPMLLWNDGWENVHPADINSGNSFFPDWELVVSADLLAQIKSALIVPAKDLTTTESTTMKLNRITRQQ